MKSRFFALLVSVILICSLSFAAQNDKKASCCDQKAHATKVSMKECTAKDAKACTAADKANCPMMKGSKTAMKTSTLKMDCCKGKATETKTSDASKLKQENKTSEAKGD